MNADEQEIRALIERWVDAVHTGDLPTVLADHDDEILLIGAGHRRIVCPPFSHD